MELRRTLAALLMLVVLTMSSGAVVFEVPAVEATGVTITVTPDTGPVGTTVTVKGTIVTPHGTYRIHLDRNANGVIEHPLELITEKVSVVLAYEHTFTIPDSYSGSRILRVTDMTTGQTADTTFTVIMSFTILVPPVHKIQHEGGPIGTLGVVKGGSTLWAGIVEFRIRVARPPAVPPPPVFTAVEANVTESTVPAFGDYKLSYTIPPATLLLAPWGTYTALLDVDKDDDGVWDPGELGVASDTFVIRSTDKPVYGRTVTAKARVLNLSGEALDKWQILDPAGVIVHDFALVPAVDPDTFTPILSWKSLKDAVLGTYTSRFITAGGLVHKPQTFSLVPAALEVSVVAPPPPAPPVSRTLTTSAKFKILYPDGTVLTSVDLPTGFKVTVFFNVTKVVDIPLDPMLHFDVPTGEWTATWKVPKHQKLGINYAFNVTAAAVVDAYGNSGPVKFVSSPLFTVKIADLDVTVPSLAYPAPGVTLPRTLEARASVRVAYPDGSLYEPVDLTWLNVTADGPADYTIPLKPADYVPGLGLWVASWRIPYDAAVGTYAFRVLARDVVDKFGNSGPVADTAPSSPFGVMKATLTLVDLKTDKPVYESGEVALITFKAFYPDGTKVTKHHPGVLPKGVPITIVPTIPGVTLPIYAKYSPAIGMWLAAFTVPPDVLGEYNITLAAWELKDDAPAPPNDGPVAEMKYEFEIIMIDVIDIDVRVGSTYFSGETVDLYVAARRRGAPFDLPVAAFTAKIFRPDGVVVPVAVEKIAPGIYKLPYTLPVPAPVGGYAAEVFVLHKIAPHVYARGHGIVTFSVSRTLSDWDGILRGLEPRLVAALFRSGNATAGFLAKAAEDLKSFVAASVGKSTADILKGVTAATADTIARIDALDLKVIGALTAAETRLVAALFRSDNATVAKVGAALAGVEGKILKALTDVEARVTKAVGDVAKVLADVEARVAKTVTDARDAVLKALTDVEARVTKAVVDVAKAVTDAKDAVLKAIAGSEGAIVKAIAESKDATAKEIRDAKAALSTELEAVKAAVIGELTHAKDAVVTEVKKGIGDLSTYVMVVGALAAILLVIQAVLLVRKRP